MGTRALWVRGLRPRRHRRRVPSGSTLRDPGGRIRGRTQRVPRCAGAPARTRLLSMITVQSLTKKYGGSTAVDDVSFTARPGRVTGFLGPNGAGKSTTMRIMVGLTPATVGSVEV